MTYNQTLKYLYDALPMFHRIGAAAYKADLSNTIKICKLLGNPEKKLKAVHIAGTNGKGSTSHMLAAVLQSNGYKVGLYTSPHLVDFRERIKINGKMIPKKSVVDFVDKHKLGFEKIKPSFFEWTVGLAYEYFAHQKVDIAIIEVGLGGRLDSTNVIKPLVSVITNISYDHTNLLGNTLTKIASEKAGIIKSKTPVVISQMQNEVYDVFIAKAKKEKAPIYFGDENFEIKVDKDSFLNTLQSFTLINKNNASQLPILLDLLGDYQRKNIKGVILALNVLATKGFQFSTDKVLKGLANVVELTGLHGRYQVMQKHPKIICDTAHNLDGIKLVMKQLKAETFTKLHVVLGMVNDKDVSGVLKLLPKDAEYYFTKASIPRALNENELLKQATKFKLKGKTFSTVSLAVEAARKGRRKVI